MYIMDFHSVNFSYTDVSYRNINVPRNILYVMFGEKQCSISISFQIKFYLVSMSRKTKKKTPSISVLLLYVLDYVFFVCRVRNCRQTQRMTMSPTKTRGRNRTKRKTTKPRSVWGLLVFFFFTMHEYNFFILDFRLLKFGQISLSVVFSQSCIMQDHPVKKHKLAKELSDLVNYCVSTRFQDFQISQQKRTYPDNKTASLG